MTAMDREELIATGRAFARRNRTERERQERELAARVAAAHTEIARLVEMFRSIDPGLAKVVLFGSLAEERVTSLGFDIDLAVECGEYYRLVSAALDSPFEVDVIDLRTASEYVRDAVRRHGKVLYDKGTGRL